MENIIDSRHKIIIGEKVIPNSIILDKNEPTIINIEKTGLPNIINDECEKDIVDIYCKDYLEISIMHSIVKESLKVVDDKRVENSELFEMINTDLKYKINKLIELKHLLLEMQILYYESYNIYMKTLEINNFINELPISYIDFIKFIKLYKKILNNSYFSLIFNNPENLNIRSYSAINSLINSRINKDVNIKVITTNWPTYYDLSGELIEETHDYDLIKTFK